MDEFDVYRSGSYAQVLGTGQVGKQMDRIHQRLEAPFTNSRFTRILELGAGSGEHLKFVRSSFEEYYLTDIRIDVLTQNIESRQGLIIEEQDVQNLRYENSYFDRVIMTCVLAHVLNPLSALSEIRRVAAHGAQVSIYIPCEPGILLRFARRFATIPKNYKAGVQDPYFHHFREHVHYYSAMNHYVRKVFARDVIKSRYYPFGIGTWNTNLYRIYQITVAESDVQAD